MCKKLFVLLLTIFLGISSYAYEAFQGPTELLHHDPSKAFQGYTIFSPFRGKNTYLIDMYGQVVHSWPYPEGFGTPGQEQIEKHARLLENGLLLRGVINRSAHQGGPPLPGAIYQLVDWNGEVVWEYSDDRSGFRAHHDFRMIWNPKLEQNTLLYVSSMDISHNEALSLGLDPSLSNDHSSRPDGLIEVDLDGNVIWEWNIRDHIIQERDPSLPNYGIVSENPGKLDIYFSGRNRPGDWIHINSLDYNYELDQIVLNNSRDSEFYVIDHGNTFVEGDVEASRELAASDRGDFLFRWGNPCVYDLGECPSSTNEGQSSTNGHQQLFFTHDIQWIRDREIGTSPSELDGTGNFLIFDNGTRRLGQVFSSILEIDPYEGEMLEGMYIPEMLAGHTLASRPGMGLVQARDSLPLISNQVIWSYRTPKANAFYGPYISGVQRLGNGNTLICSGPHGHIFEITPEGEVVWEYVSPVGDRTQGDYGIYRTMTADSGTMFNAFFKCARYAPNYEGLEGKDLTPRGKITELFTNEPERPTR
ncbi:MAG: hypothetical protein CBC38_06715 [Gammaproteobacteria bacterium TMED78]|nr:MAG: hypothetical protein CBC38_06715 [Gammaproteobacteria bacterium TMED78]|tara:strand:- start:25107 stop:26702 length:1596 start_codon:yes stop_codon:yes gene_type:complete